MTNLQLLRVLSDKLTAIVDTMAVVRESHPCGSELCRDVGVEDGERR